jgi:hypothetical protein
VSARCPCDGLFGGEGCSCGRFICKSGTSDLHHTSTSLSAVSTEWETAGSTGPNGQLQRYCGELNTVLEYSYNRSQQHALLLNFILVENSTCFGRTCCTSSGVLIPNSQQMVFVILVMLTVHPDLASRQAT